MVGLVLADTLHLSFVQWSAVSVNFAGWLWCYWHPKHWKTIMALTFSGLWLAFWNTPTTLDQQLLFEQARYLSSFRWEAFIEEVIRRPYVKNQVPFVTFWFSRIPVLWIHQLILLPFASLCGSLMWQLYGRSASLLMASPLFALMIHQPSHDVLLFGVLLITLRLVQMQKRKYAALVYGCAWLIKPLIILTTPFMLLRLGGWGVGSLGMWGGYVLWSQQWPFGRYQWRFLLQQVLLVSMRRPKAGSTGRHASGLWKKVFRSLSWRWEYIGKRTVYAFPWYLFPTWMRVWNWQGITLAAIILLGYGNIKYLLLDLVFLFPVHSPDEKEDSQWNPLTHKTLHGGIAYAQSKTYTT